MPIAAPTVFFQATEQPGLALSQISAQVGNDIAATALRTVAMSAGVTGTVTRLKVLPVVHGCLPELQFNASCVNSFEIGRAHV